ncbi:MAG: (d)CMP kinase [Oscillospiraceae bacterium]|nr:(d)CMP kinase [Oscillospiraceae bacterium]
MKYISVAVDGPAGAGKSTISKNVAAQLGFVYIDTGAMYRAAALYAINNGIDIKKEADILIDRLDDIKIEMKNIDGSHHVYLCGEDVSEIIRREDVSAGASSVAVIPEVREKLVAMQKKMAERDNVIMDGRDICSHVLPNAQVKIFLTASSEERARRRYKELLEKGVECDFETIKSDMEVRDKNDSSRAVSPLRVAEDATVVDTTGLDFEQSVRKIRELVENVL